MTPDSLENLLTQAKAIGFGDPDRLSQATDLLLQAAEAAENNHYLAEGYNLKGGIARFGGQHDEAARYILLAHEYFVADRDKDGQARALGNLGSLFYYSKQYKEGMIYAESALTLALELDEPNRLAVNLLSVGLFKLALDQPDTAISYLRRAETLLKDESESPYLSAIYNNLGKAYLLNQELDRSLYYYMEGRQNTLEQQNEYSQAYSLAGIAAVYAQQGKYDKATPLYELALQIAEKGNWHQEAHQFARALANSYAQQSNYAQAYAMDTLAYHHQNQITPVAPISLTDRNNASTQTALTKLLQRLSAQQQSGNEEIPNWALAAGMVMAVVILILGWILLAKQTEIGNLKRGNAYLTQTLRQAQIEKSTLNNAQSELANREEDVDLMLKFKNQLYQVMVYELRDPLVGLLGMHQQVMDGELTGKERRQMNMEAQRHLQNLYFILQAIILWVRMQDNGIRPGNVEVDCEKLINTTLKHITPLAKSYEIKLHLLPHGCAPFTGDRELVQHILQLMLFNGIRLAKDTVTLRSYSGEGRVIFAVETNELRRNELIASLWNQPEPQDLPTGLNHSTTGLTLWLAHQLTYQLGGHTWEEFDPDHGQVLKIALPLSKKGEAPLPLTHNMVAV